MATKTVTQKPATTTPKADPALALARAVFGEGQLGELANLVAQQRELAAKIKELRAARTTESALDRVIARQSTNFTKWLPLGLEMRVRARVRAGQPVADAIEAVFTAYRAIVEERLTADPGATQDETA